MDPIRVFVIDDHPIFRHGLAAMIAAEPAFLWVGEAADGEEAVHVAAALAPDVVLIDLMMPGTDVVEVIQTLRMRLPCTRFVVLTCTLQTPDVRRCLAAGATSFLLKNTSVQTLVNVIYAARRGQCVLSPEVTEALAASAKAGTLGADLTQRERKLLALMAQGKANQEISALLAIAIPTVKFHVTNILAKLNAENRTTAVLAALRHKIVCLE